MRIIIYCTLLLLSTQIFAQDARLAREYYNNGEFEKAVPLYKKLHDRDRTNDYYFERYYLTLLELEDYAESERMIKKAIKASPEKVQRYVNFGIIQERQNKNEKAAEQYEKAIKLLPAQQVQIVKLAETFTTNKKFDYAVQTFEKGGKLMREKNMFAYELGRVYQLQGNTKKMISSYLDCLLYLPNRMTNVEGIFQRYLQPMDGGYAMLKTELYARIQKSSNTTYPELLIWVFMQEGDYSNALKQAKALDKRLNENGSRIYRLAQTAIREENYEAGIDAYAYIISKGRICPYYIDAKQQILAAKRKRLVKGYAYTMDDLKVMEKEYEDFLDEFGRNRESSKIMRELAQFEAKYLNDNNKAISILEEVIKIPSISRNDRNESKIELGDYYLMKGEIWEATLLYSQVDKEMDDAPLGEEARFKNAKLSYYKGDFEWSQDQLEILKGSTSELIANDAIDLSVFIMDHYSLDTTARPMMMFARAQLLNFQNRFDESFLVMDSIVDITGKHGLVDDIYFTKAEIHIQKREYPQAIKLLEEIIEKHGDGILADNAIFTLAELHEERLNQPDDAKELYQKILFDYSGSILAVEAGKRFRRLRGDMSSDGKVTPPWKTNNQ